MKLSAKATVYGCYLGYVTQAIVNNLPPLLFLTFRREFGVTLEQISLLITMNFCVQILVDLISPKIIEKTGYRKAALCAFLTVMLGLTGFYWLPFVLPPYAGILLCMVCNAIGGGILEVIVSPMVEACPGENKEARMSFLHSFYCWGHMGVVLLSTLYFALAGIENWRFLPPLWALVPLGTFLLFTGVPIYTLHGDDEETRLPKSIFRYPVFWVLFLLMICAGASEQAVSQWSSLFAEEGLKISKTMGDLLGPCAFAFCMGLSRLFYGLQGEKLNILLSLKATSMLCIGGYLVTALSPLPLLSLAGCALCGFSVGLMWPGIFSLGASYLKGGGTFMFAMFALAGDVGCSAGPAVVGILSDMTGTLNLGILAAIVFPTGLLGLSWGLGKRRG